MLKFKPTNEQEVVYLFGFVVEKLEFEIERIQTGFPDCTLFTKKGERLRVEFEYISSNFILHGHPIEECDLVVVWEDNCNLKKKIKVLELKEYFPELKTNSKIKSPSQNITQTCLDLIFNDKGTYENFQKVFATYHPSEKNKEGIRFFARLVSNEAGPKVKDGKLILEKSIDRFKLKYAVAKNRKAMQQARLILDELKESA